MPTAGIRVLFVEKSWPIEGYQIEVCSKINQLLGQIARFKPDVIVSSTFIPGALNLSGFEIRKRWLHIKPETPIEAATNAIEICYSSIMWKPHPYAKDNPLISVYTPTYNTGDFLRDTYASLRDQTYCNWEWVVIDDGSTDGTWDRLKEMAQEDYRVRPMQSMHIGKIGALKGAATRLAYGEFVVELDHDDMFTDTALEEVRKAFLDPEVGMVYSNCAAFFQNGAPQKYGGDFWESRYRETEYRGKKYTEARGPDIYDRFGPNYWQQFGWFLTVGPNHLRAYRRSKLEELGGYNPALPVADDWDVYARFFLRSKVVWLDRMLYLYRFLDGFSNTTFTKNKSIQDHLELGRRNYAAEFDEFNKKRLNPVSVSDSDSNILLTIAVPSVGDRLSGTALPLLQELFKQAEGKPVEVLCYLDNRMNTVSEKRNWAIRDAHGKFTAFIDDDDMVAPDYVDSILKAICENPTAQIVVFDVFVEGYALDGSPSTAEKPAVNRINKQGMEYTYQVTPEAFYCAPSQWMAWRTTIMRKAPPYPNQNAEDAIWAAGARQFVDPKFQVRIDKTLYYYRFCPKSTTQGVAMSAVETRRKTLAQWGLEKPAPVLADVGFVVATRNDETAKPVGAMLKDVPHFIAVGAKSVLEAYEAGRTHFKDTPRIVYLHDDVIVSDMAKFVEMVKALPPGLHGPCGSAAPGVLDGEKPWWDVDPKFGKILQYVNPTQTKLLEFSKAEKPEEVQWLDGLCLVAVEQKWDWKIEGDPVLWHGYDWLACKRTLAAGGKCYTFQQPGEPMLAHRGLGRMEGFEEAMKIVRAGLGKTELKPHGGSLSVVVLDWNTKEKTLSCVHSVRSFYPDAEIILVQNGEKFDCPEANKVIPLEVNVGYAAGVNRGVMESSREYVCLLNSDTFVSGVTLFDKLLAELQDPTVGIVAPYATQARPPQGDYAEKDCPQGSLDIPVVFVCVVLRKSLFDELGGMDPRLCTYEDDDFCRRLMAKGLKSRVVGGAWIRHDGHASFEANSLDHLQVEAANLQKFNAKWPKVAVVTLTKDEREALPGFFDQFRSVTRDFAALDSGSTDGTVEWAKENGVRVTSRHFTRFDEQRNAAIKLAKGCDWVVMLDPDERLDEHTIKCIPDLVRSDEFDIYLAPLRAENRDGSFTEWVGKPFLFRNKPEIRWALPVHEKLIGSKRQAWIKNGMITHVIKLHEHERRQKSEGFYAKLAKLPAQDVSSWPILDYEHRDHPDIEKIWTGPLVSVVIPSYNRLRMLARAVESVKLQDYRPVEIVVVGDACGQLQDLAASGNMTVVNLPTNHGAGGGAPRNYGIALASGRWVAFLDDDNEWTPGHLSSLMEAVERAGAEFGISSMKTLGKDLIFREPKRGQMDTSCLLHRKNLVERFGWWGDRVEKGYAHDWEFIRPWVEAGVKYVMTQKPTCLYSAETSGQHEFLKSLVGEARG